MLSKLNFKKSLAIIMCSSMLASVGFAKDAKVIPLPDHQDITIEGAASAPKEINHKTSPYFRKLDFYNMKSNQQLTILTHFPTYQQTSEYTCGPAAALMTMWYYNQRGMNEYEIAGIMQTDTHVGTDVSKMVKFFQGINWTVKSSLDTPLFSDPYDFKKFAVNNLKAGHPILVENVEWSGHWRVIIGYDDMGTENLLDDVLILADSYDTADHLQDGYAVQNTVKFFYEWFDHQMLPASERTQPFVIAYPKEVGTNS